ncbi:hypothetical protein Tco_1535086 [Tanacetum coccineum]
MTAMILENCNQQLILEFSLLMHQAGRVIESTTKEPDESWKLFTYNSMSCLSRYPPRVERPVSPALAVLVPVNSAGTPSFTTIDQDAPSPNNPFAHADNDPFVNVFASEPSSEASSSGDASSAESTNVIQPYHHLKK